VGGIPEVIEDNVSGVLVPSGDADVLAAAVQGLIEHPARRLALGRAAQQRARARFSADIIVPCYEALYRRLVGASRLGCVETSNFKIQNPEKLQAPSTKLQT